MKEREHVSSACIQSVRDKAISRQSSVVSPSYGFRCVTAIWSSVVSDFGLRPRYAQTRSFSNGQFAVADQRSLSTSASVFESFSVAVSAILCILLPSNSLTQQASHGIAGRHPGYTLFVESTADRSAAGSRISALVAMSP